MWSDYGLRVGRILCFSDLHLGEPTEEQVVGNFKVPLGADDEHPTTQDIVTRTLRDACDEANPFDAVVVAGDLTNRFSEQGFSAFTALMDELEPCLPSAQNVLVVPGNHDVPYQSDPSKLARYDKFLEVTRDRGYTTPMLDGLDFPAKSGYQEKGFTRSGPHVVETDDFVIVPINSSNWCHYVAPLREDQAAWDDFTNGIQEDLRGDFQDQLRKLQTFDLPRVSPEQVDALRAFLDGQGLGSEKGDDRVRIAVLHHHLLPVSTEEEVKSFESLTNLAAVRQFLQSAGFHLVLHGHKHQSRMYWDADHRAGTTITDPLRRIFVVAAPGDFRPGGESVRVIETEGLPRARTLAITTILGAEAGQPANRERPVSIPLWLARMESSPSPSTTISGSTTRVVYERARVLLESGDRKQINDLLCIVDGPTGADRLPDAYPEMRADSQKWFDDLVGWWQLPESEILRIGVRDFNHGERIYPGEKIEEGIRVLVGDPSSSRVLIQIVRPHETCRADVEFPAFSSVHLRLVEVGPESYRLDCIGWFRKQEMRYWWPVNVRELSIIQEHALDSLGKKMDVRAGRLVTYASMAVYGKELPLLAVAEVDRLLDFPDTMWRLAVSLAFPDRARQEERDAWGRILEELEPHEEQLIVPELGLTEIADNLSRLMEFAPGLESLMTDLQTAVQAFEIAGAVDVPDATKRAKVAEAMSRLQQSVTMRLEGAKATEAPEIPGSVTPQE